MSEAPKIGNLNGHSLYQYLLIQELALGLATAEGQAQRQYERGKRALAKEIMKLLIDGRFSL